MLDSKLKDSCRICARELCGNHRRWIFHPAAKLNLQTLLSHALGREVTRDGRGEFACGKCAFVLERMYRFDTVIARVEALSIERMQKLLLEKERLRQGVGALYWKNNTSASADSGVKVELLEDGGGAMDISALSEISYSALLQDDLAYSVFESWAEQESTLDYNSQQSLHTHHHHHHHPHSRKCRGCAALRVADSDYEAVCKLPRRLRSTSCGPPTRCSGGAEEAGVGGTPMPQPEPSPLPAKEGGEQGEGAERMTPSPASSVESLDTLPLETAPPVDHLTPPAEGRPEEEVVGAERSSSPQELTRPDLSAPEPDAGGTPCISSGLESGAAYASGLELALSLARSLQYRPVQSRSGSRLPVRVKPAPGPAHEGVRHGSPYGAAADCPLSPLLLLEGKSFGGRQGELQHELAEMEELWLDEFTSCRPLHLQEKLIEEQQTQLGDYERAASQCVCELQKAQQQVRCLQTNIRESEANNQKLQRRLAEMELELRAVREVAQGQESTIGTLSDSLSTTQAQVSDLQRVNKDQKEMLLSLKSQCQRQQLTKGDALAAEASLFSNQLELQECQRARGHALRQEEDLNRAIQRLHDDLQRALKHRKETETHNLDLLSALQKARSDLQQLEEEMREKEGERRSLAEEREKTIRQLRSSLQTKDKLLEDYSDLLDSVGQKGSGERGRESVITKLKQRIQERDRALERAVDEKFVCVEQRELEVRKLQLQLREKERDLDKLHCVCANNEETITSLEALLRGKGLELEQVCEALRSARCVQQDFEEQHTLALRERDTLISQLQSSLHTHAKENETLTSSLLNKLRVSPAAVVEELKTRLSLKEKLIQDLLRDRGHQAQEHQAQVQDLLTTINSRDQYIQDAAGRVGEVMSEQMARVQELRRQLVFAQTQESAADRAAQADTQALQEELRLALRREREAQQELSSLRASLTGQQIQLQAQASLLKAQGKPDQKTLNHQVAAMETEQTSQSQAEFAGGHWKRV